MVSIINLSNPLKRLWRNNLISLTANIDEGNDKVSLVDMKQIQKDLNISYSTLHRWMKKGLPYYKPRGGRKVQFNRDKVEEWLSENTI